MSARGARAELQATPRRHERAPRRGEARRASLLQALEHLLATTPLAQIGVGDIATAANVTRSAFYFYFPTKAAAVAALLEDIYEDLLEATGKWHSSETADGRKALREGFDALAAYCHAHPRLIVATFDAVGSDAEVREMWESSMDQLAQRVAEKITAERDAGRALAGAAPAALATSLVAMNERTLEREARAIVDGAAPSDTITDALFEIWARTVYDTAS